MTASLIQSSFTYLIIIDRRLPFFYCRNDVRVEEAIPARPHLPKIEVRQQLLSQIGHSQWETRPHRFCSSLQFIQSFVDSLPHLSIKSLPPAPATQPPPTRKLAPVTLASKPTIERTSTPAQRAPAAIIKPMIERTPTPAARRPQLPMPPSSLVGPHDRIIVTYPVAAPSPQLTTELASETDVSVVITRDSFLSRIDNLVNLIVSRV